MTGPHVRRAAFGRGPRRFEHGSAARGASRPCALVGAALALIGVTGASLAGGPLAQNASSPARSVLDGVFTAGQAARGLQQFKLTCTSCHSPADHSGRKFEEKYQGITVGDLFDLMSNTMPEKEPGSLKPEEYASILAFLLSETGYKAGDKDLPSDLESLKKIRIEPLPR